MTLSIGQAWEETSAFLGREARLVAPVALATFALPAVMTGWAYPGGGQGSIASLLLIVVLLAVLVGQMTIVLLATGWGGSIGQAMLKAMRRVPALIGALLIVFLPIMLVTVIGFGVSLSSAGITEVSQLTPDSIARLPNILWLLVVLTLVLIIAGVRLFPISAIGASEAGGPITLLRRSWTLTKGSFWRILVLAFLLAIVAVVLDRAVTAVVGSIAALAAGEARAFNLSALIVALAAGLVGALVSTVSATMVGRVYVQLTSKSPPADVAKG